METSSKRVYATPCVTWVCCSQSLCPRSRPLLNHASTGDTQIPKGQPGSVSVGSLGTGAQKVSFEPFWASLVGMGCDTKWGFAPPTVFLGLLLSLWCGMSFFGGVQHSPVDSCSLASCSFGVLAGEDECTSIYFSILLSLFLNICTHIIYTCAYIHTYTYMSTCCSLLSSVWLFVTPWTASCQDSLSFTVSRNLLKLMSIELVMPSNHLILCHHLLLPSILPSIRVFSNESFASGGQIIGTSASASVPPVNIQAWFPLGLTGLTSLLSKRLSRVFSSTTFWKHQFFGAHICMPSTHIHICQVGRLMSNTG